MQHTPGPWAIDPEMRGLGNVTVAGVRAVNGESVANCGTDGHANARLIAAAPALLRVAQALAGANCPEAVAFATQLAHAAIAQARGEQ